MKKLTILLALGLGGCIYHGHVPGEPLPAGPPLGRDEVERLAAAGVSDPVLIELAEKRGAKPLSADDIVSIKKAGASDAVVQKLIALERKAPEPVAAEDVYYTPAPTYIYYYDRPYYYSSFGFGWGFGYSRSSHCYRGSGLGVRIRR